MFVEEPVRALDAVIEVASAGKGGVLQAELSARYGRATEQVQRVTSKAGIEVQPLLIARGCPADTILYYVREVGFDLVVLGRRGGGLAHRLRPGSTAHKVVACSPSPVMIVP